MIHEDTLLPDVRKCEEIIRNARKDSPDTPSDEWLADNYHIVSDAIESLKHLEFKRRAVIAVYNIATEILSRNDGLVREEDVLKVVSFHQNTHPLGSESLVYLCPMLQLAVVKRIADICETTEKSKEPRMLISLGVSMGNAIKSLRSLPTFDWENMLSELNVIEQILRGDPADIYLNQLNSIPFRKQGHVSGKTENITIYYNDQYRITINYVTKVKKNGDFGKTKKYYCYKNKWYSKVEKFLEEIKDVKFINNEQKYEAF